MTLPRENPQDQRMMGDFDAFMRSVQTLLQRYENGGDHTRQMQQQLAQIDAVIERIHQSVLAKDAKPNWHGRFPAKQMPALIPLMTRLRHLLRDYLGIDQASQAQLEALLALRALLTEQDRLLGDLQSAVARMVPFGRDASPHSAPQGKISAP